MSQPPQYLPYGQQGYYGAPPRRKTSPVLIVILLVVVGGFAALVGGVFLFGGKETPTEDWVVHNETNGGYTCKFPEAPLSKVETKQTPGGGLMTQRTAYVENRRRAYMVMWADMPAGGVHDGNRSEVLDGAVDGGVRGGGGSLVSKRTVMIGGYEGREYESKLDKGNIIARVFLVGDRLFQMIIAYSDNFEPEADFFFNSIVLK